MEGFLKVASASPRLRPADVSGNVEAMTGIIEEAYKRDVKILVLPELCISGYTCGDLFLQKRLIDASRKGLYDLIKAGADKDMLIFAGLPWFFSGKLYSTVAVFKDGELLGLVPKTILSGGEGAFEERHFVKGSMDLSYTAEGVPFSGGLIFECTNVPGLSIAAESGAEIGAAVSPADLLSLRGAAVVAGLGASFETYGRAKRRAELIRGKSRRLSIGYIAAFAGAGESTTDYVYGGQCLVAELGDILSENPLYTEDRLCITDLDIEAISGERRSLASEREESLKLFKASSAAWESGALGGAGTQAVSFGFKSLRSKVLDRHISKAPFLSGVEDKASMSGEILDIQSRALIKRFTHTGSKKAVLGLSGGLDSTLALLALRHAFSLMGRPMSDIICVTMPCFGTTDRTYDNACTLAREIGAELREIRISDSILKHFEDIGHDPDVRNSAYENAQARERTQILMDIANDVGGLDIGTGDLSEEALGWCTFGGDHMANYSVNTSIPKTLIRVIVSEIAASEANERIAAVLKDILDTPVSPELLPSDDNGSIKQKTEDIVGPYELHDFFLYYAVKYGSSPRRIYELACEAFKGDYESAEIKKWLEVFYKRFFSQQFKRSTALDGPKVSEIDLSPRGGYMMPSDACAEEWLREIASL